MTVSSRNHHVVFPSLLGVACAALLGCGASDGSGAPESSAYEGEPIAHEDGIATKRRDAGAARVDAGPPPVCSNTSYPRTPSDPGSRIIVDARVDQDGNGTIFPSPTRSWTIQYQFVVPAVPCSPTWNPDNQTFYVWGDVDFDRYGAQYDATSVSSYLYNQIVPQLMIGQTFNEDPSTPYRPGSGAFFSNWVIEAQYFWQNHLDNSAYVQAGSPIAVSPGDVTTTKIAYNATSGSIVASIAAPRGTSSITIPRPFPNTSPPLFSSWKDFFTKAAAKTGGVLHARPQMNVESHFVDLATLCQLAPWKVDAIAIPNVSAVPSSFTIGTWPTTATGGPSFSCASPLANLNF